MANAAINRRRAGAARAPVARRFGLTILVFAAAAGIGYGGVTLSADPRFALGEIGVRGQQRASLESILSAAAMPAGRNIWLMDTSRPERRVEMLPWIASARVQRGWPNQVAIVVTERAPAARLALDGGGEALVDADGRVLGDVPETTDQALPALVVQPMPPAASVGGSELAATSVGKALSAARQLAALGVHVTEVRSEPVMGFSAMTAAHARVVFGDLDDLARKVELFEAISKRVARPADVEYIDVRSIAAPTVQYRR